MLTSPPTESQNHKTTRQVQRTNCNNYSALNFDDSKGLTFDQILIIPHGKLKELLKTSDFREIEKSVAKVYVAVNHAKCSEVFVYEEICTIDDFLVVNRL